MRSGIRRVRRGEAEQALVLENAEAMTRQIFNTGSPGEEASGGALEAMAALPPLPAEYAPRMRQWEEAEKLSLAGRDARGRRAYLTPAAAEAWAAMNRAAAKEGRILLLLSAFRSYSRQRDIVLAKWRAGRSWEEILTVSAYPGYSEHHTGRAVDIGAPGVAPFTEPFESTPQFAWLSRHAGRFGFTLSYPRDNPFGIAFEPWHWCMSREETTRKLPAAADSIQ